MDWKARLLFLNFLLATLPACRQERETTAATLQKRLEPYDFQGRTVRALERFCRNVPSRPEAAWLCARTLLDWHLLAAYGPTPSLLNGLAKHLNLDCEPSRSTACGVRVLEALEAVFQKLDHTYPKTLAWRTRHAHELLRLLLDEAPSWGPTFLRGIHELTTHRPLAVEASVVVAGALRAALPRIRQAVLWHRPQLLARYVGFACPDGRPCPLGCPELDQELALARPELRKRLILAHCPLSWLGFRSRDEARLLSESGFRTVRNLAFAARTLKLLLDATHPLARAIRKDLLALQRDVTDTVFPLPYPELSPGDAGYRRIAYCTAAGEPAFSPLFVSMGENHLRAGLGPLVHAAQEGLAVVGEQEGLAYPGRIVPPSAEALRAVLAEAARIWTSSAGPLGGEPAALVLDARIPASVFVDHLRLLFQAGITKVRLLLRNFRAELGGLTVRLEACPDARPRWRRTALKGVSLWADGQEMRVTADHGPLAETPLTAPVSDISGLRERLEKTRRAYAKQNDIHVFLRGALSFRDLARLLDSSVRNSSGRALYPEASLVLCRYP